MADENVKDKDKKKENVEAKPAEKKEEVQEEVKTEKGPGKEEKPEKEAKRESEDKEEVKEKKKEDKTPGKQTKKAAKETSEKKGKKPEDKKEVEKKKETNKGEKKTSAKKVDKKKEPKKTTSKKKTEDEKSEKVEEKKKGSEDEKKEEKTKTSKKTSSKEEKKSDKKDEGEKKEPKEKEVEKEKEREPFKEELVFGKYNVRDVIVEDPGLAKMINLDPTYVPHSSARYANKPFAKSKISIVERLINSLMRTERFTGKKTKSYRLVYDAFKMIEDKTKENPIQILVQAIENAAPREEVTRLKFGGISVPKSVDTSPARRVDIALRNISNGTIKATHKNKKPVSTCLSDELISASKGDLQSYSVSKRDEIERVAKSAH